MTRARGKLWHIVGLVVVAVAVPFSVSAQAVLSFQSIPASLAIENQIFTEARTSLPITVAHEGDAVSWFVTVSRGNAGGFNPRELQRRFFFFFVLSTEYNIFTPSDEIARDLSGPLPSGSVISGSFPASASLQTRSAQFSVRLPAEQFVRQGSYTDAVDVSLYRGSPSAPGDAVLVERQSVDITSLTSTVAQVGLVETSGAGTSGQRDFSMEFGPLSTGQTRRVDLVYRANSSFLVEAASSNGGVLLNVNRPGGFTIPYEFRYEGTVYDLSPSEVIDLSFLSGTGLSFSRGRIEVEIGEFSNPPSGLYEDVITFTISTF